RLKRPGVKRPAAISAGCGLNGQARPAGTPNSHRGGKADPRRPILSATVRSGRRRRPATRVGGAGELIGRSWSIGRFNIKTDRPHLLSPVAGNHLYAHRKMLSRRERNTE